MSHTSQDRAQVAVTQDPALKRDAGRRSRQGSRSDPMTIDLARRRILVVEDEAILAMDIVAEIEDHNGVVLGPVSTLEAGLNALRNEKPDACIVNINLGPDLVYELADMLIEQDVPFVFASSELRSNIPDRFNDVPLHTKPIKMVEAAGALMRNGARKAGE
jgi:CheY-like chemotaxis protein